MTNEEFRKYIIEKLEEMEKTINYIYNNTDRLYDIIDRMDNIEDIKKKMEVHKMDNVSVDLSFENVGDANGLTEEDKEVIKKFDNTIHEFRTEMITQMKKKNMKPKIVESVITEE